MSIKETVVRELNKELVLKYQPKNDGWAGIVVFKDKVAHRAENEDRIKLLQELEEFATRLNTSFFGYGGAIKRFLTVFEDGFEDAQYIKREREYKLKAKTKLDTGASLEQALLSQADISAAIASVKSTALIHHYESPPFLKLLETNGIHFLKVLADFAVAPSKQTFDHVALLLKKNDCAKWPCLTYIPFLWMPDQHMFLKPGALKEFAERVGDKFQFFYESDLTYSVYQSLIEMTETTRSNIQSLNPADNIDVQGFIWTSIMYDNNDF